MHRDNAPPLNPGGATAHAWLRRELAKPVYADQRSWLQRLWDWATGRLGELLHGVGGGLPLVVLIPLLLAVVALVIFGLSRLSRRGRIAHPRPEGVLADEELSAEQFRRRAERADDEGAHSAAFIDYFRALTRRAEERALLLAQPGRTAHEVSVELAPYFPSQQAELGDAATFFDRVRYGGAAAIPADVARIRALDAQLDGARPTHPAVPWAMA